MRAYARWHCTIMMARPTFRATACLIAARAATYTKCARFVLWLFCALRCGSNAPPCAIVWRKAHQHAICSNKNAQTNGPLLHSTIIISASDTWSSLSLSSPRHKSVLSCVWFCKYEYIYIYSVADAVFRSGYGLYIYATATFKCAPLLSWHELHTRSAYIT